MKILVVEDDKSIAELLEIQLKLHGYEVMLASHGQMALSILKDHQVDLIVLDMMMPVMDGYDFLNVFDQTVPVIALTAKHQIEDKVKGFTLGVDDYVTKPFEFIELLMRIKAVLNRTCKDHKRYSKFDVVVDFIHRSVTLNEEVVNLTLKEYDLLVFFIEHEGVALSRDKLLEAVWDFDYLGNTRTIDIHVQKLRKKLNLPISTVFKYGYRLEQS